MRRVLRLALQGRRFEVLEAADGQHALATLGETGPADLALFDWNMPGMNGLELLRAVRADHRFDGMRIIMVTTETELAQVRRALEQGADEYVMKPFTREVVLDKLRLIGL
jgi:two-component system chemotaxis response regulator CheY